jgi:hypothetical protein
VYERANSPESAQSAQSPPSSSMVARRICFGLLFAASLFLLSGHAPQRFVASAAGLPAVSAGPQAYPDSGGTVPFEALVREVDMRLANVNPSLTARERSRIATALHRYSDQYDLDPDLVFAIILVESDARPWAHSSAGAVGLMQVMPHMMRSMSLAGNFATIESNIEAGCQILSHNIRRLGLERGISAYFWGSNIRGVAYLEKVLEARERVRVQRKS